MYQPPPSHFDINVTPNHQWSSLKEDYATKNLELHANLRDWSFSDFEFFGIQHRAHRIEATEEAVGNVFFMPGCGTSDLQASYVPNRFSRHGMNVISTRQLQTHEHGYNIGANKQLIHFLLLDKRSPLREMIDDPSKPFFIVAHSSTSLLINNVALKYGDPLIRNVDAIFSDSAYFDASGAESTHGSDFIPPSTRGLMRIKERAYVDHATKHFEAVLGEPTLDKCVMRLRGSKKSAKGTALRAATHGEGLTYKFLGVHVYDRLEQLSHSNPEHPALNIPEFYYAGDYDPASSSLITRDIVGFKNNAALLKTYAEHDGFTQDRRAFAHMLHSMHLITESFHANGKGAFIIPDELKTFAQLPDFNEIFTPQRS